MRPIHQWAGPFMNGTLMTTGPAHSSSTGGEMLEAHERAVFSFNRGLESADAEWLLEEEPFLHVPPQRAYAETATQCTPPHPNPSPPPKSYAEVAASPALPPASSTTSSASSASSTHDTEFSLYEDISEYEREEAFYPHKNKGKGKRAHTQGKQRRRPKAPPAPTPQFAVVIHAVPLKYKVGEVRRWLEEDNQYLQIAGARWLLPENRRLDKAHSSMVLYLQDPTVRTSLRLGRKTLRTTTYEWNR